MVIKIAIRFMDKVEWQETGLSLVGSYKRGGTVLMEQRTRDLGMVR